MNWLALDPEVDPEWADARTILDAASACADSVQQRDGRGLSVLAWGCPSAERRHVYAVYFCTVNSTRGRHLRKGDSVCVVADDVSKALRVFVCGVVGRRSCIGSALNFLQLYERRVQ